MLLLLQNLKMKMQQRKDTEPNKTDVKITEFKVENTKWKKGGLADE